MDCVSTLTALEEALWQEETRFDSDWMDAVLASDYFEFGRSGRRWSRGEILSIRRATINVRLPLPNLQARLLNEETALVTYDSEVKRNGQMEFAHRSSIWSKMQTAWVLRFHQGTPFQP